MTPTQLRAILDRLGLSQLGAGRLLGTGERTPRRWASGESEVPSPVAIILRLLDAGVVTAEQIDAARRGKLVE